MAGAWHGWPWTTRRKDDNVVDDEAERRARTRRVGLIVAVVAFTLFALPFVWKLLP